MIDNYKIKIINSFEELFLYINYDYFYIIDEFDKYYDTIIKEIKEYILKHKIYFRGNKINIVINGVVQKIIELDRINDNNVHKSEFNEEIIDDFDVDEIVEDLSI